MVYDVYLERSATDDLRRLPRRLSDRITARIGRLANDPRPAGCRKMEGSKSDWRIRVGEYRVIYEIDDDLDRVNVMRVRHRREVYK